MLLSDIRLVFPESRETASMRMPVTLMMAIGKAALNVAGVGLVGDAAEIGKAAWGLWKRSPEERLDELEAVVRADDAEIANAAEQVAAALAADQPEEVRIKLATFLKQVPSRIRQLQRRPADPTGRTMRPGFAVGRAEDVIPFVPDQLPLFKAGDQPLAGVDWVLVELLGMGGFGEVWKARHAHFDSFEPVALKFCTDPVARQRLLRHEAKVLDRVMRQGRHRGIVRLEATYLSADPPCLQYEYVSGGDLGGLIDDWHRQPQKPSPERVAQAMLALAEIVAFAHRTDPPIVHRDLKPANILVEEPNGGAIAFKVTDFGIGGIAIARAVQASRVPTSPSEFMTVAVRGSGTWLYASPEQLNGHDPDPRDDVHALGVIWYQMLTSDLTKGRPGGTAWRRRFVERGLSAALLDLLESCFEDREDRPADAGFMADRLGELLKEPVPAPPAQVKRSDEPAMEIINSIGMKLRLIPAGEFMMGSTETDDEKPRHLVTISRPFYLGVYPVTQREYLEVERKNPSHFSGNDLLPVETVSWLDAVAFCNVLSEEEGLKAFLTIKGQSVEVPDWNGPGYRLPTEAEWEYACRAGTTTRYSFGDDGNKLGRYAWHFSNSNQQTHPVGAKARNPFGVHDIYGNVWEWCWDGYDAAYYAQSPRVDPRGPALPSVRVIRGGGWNVGGQHARSAYRYGIVQESRNDDLGFRVARI
jgi:formylglycine-generating enzyme required for sulfatase activity